MENKIRIHSCDGILLGNKKEQITHIHNMNEPCRHYAEQKKLDTKKSTYCVYL